MVFDVNAARAQRLEAHGDAFHFTLDGEEFSLPTELDVDVLDTIKTLDESDLKGVLGAIVGDAGAAERLFAHKLSVQDVKAIMTAWREETGAGVGEDSTSAS
ncbi:hypothetical protein [Kitasatospora mediocidica]|uniref:hypothetical protein n=1 Tax=Kitasatospora mediocidica TaxID=58352 RepID=UPI00056A9F17|nr:hypothetical protein [Kitasatospora mediocidica]